MCLRESGGVPTGHHEQPGAAHTEKYPNVTKNSKTYEYTLITLKMSLNEPLTGWNGRSFGTAGEPGSLQEMTCSTGSKQEVNRK